MKQQIRKPPAFRTLSYVAMALAGFGLGFLTCYLFLVPGEKEREIVELQPEDSTVVKAIPEPDSLSSLPEEELFLVDTNDPLPLTGEEIDELSTISGYGLAIPVAGVTSNQLYDSFDDGRSEGRVHEAIDIPAPEGTPVLAAVHGRIEKLFLSDKGGVTIYQRGDDGKTIYYYAHLQKYEPGLIEGQVVKQGQRIGYVGNTGNAGPDNYHLHFAIWETEDSTSFWDGRSINPYPLLVK